MESHRKDKKIFVQTVALLKTTLVASNTRDIERTTALLRYANNFIESTTTVKPGGTIAKTKGTLLKDKKLLKEFVGMKKAEKEKFSGDEDDTDEDEDGDDVDKNKNQNKDQDEGMDEDQDGYDDEDAESEVEDELVSKKLRIK